jgi:hypothetical protein
VSDRLAELQRQRALAQAQLAWFDREIATETGHTPPPAAPAGAPLAPAMNDAAAPAQMANDATVARTAADIIATYQQAPGDSASRVRKGCYLWFAFVMMTVVLCAAGIYFMYRSR